MILNRKRIFFVFVAVVLIVIILLSVFSNNNEQPPIFKAKILAFTADTSFQPIVGVTLVMSFNVTLQNIGKNNITSANVAVQRATNGTDTLVRWVYLDDNIIDLQSNETKLLRTTLLTPLNYYNDVASSNFIARISLNGTILDERKLF